MSRVVWFAAGAASGVYGVVRAKRLLYHLTPDGIAGRMAALGVGLRMFADEVQTGMAEGEAQLRGRLRLDAPGTRMIEAHRHAEEHSTDGDR